jgi:hypothetical protein
MTMLFPDSPVHGFDDWWRAYPRKIDKDAARKTYETVIRARRATHRELLDGVMRYAVECEGKDPQFIKHGRTWLNSGSWKNEHQESTRGTIFDVHEELHR